MHSPDTPDITEMLSRSLKNADLSHGELFEAVSGELRRLAAAQMVHERAGHTLQPTALVNEAFARLVGQSATGYESRDHFLAIAATAMRRVLVDHARARQAQKRGGDAHRITLTDAVALTPDDQPIDLLELEDELEKLGRDHERSLRVVELRFFGGLTVERTATAIGVSERTVKEDWRYARAFLRRSLAERARSTRAGGSSQ